MSFVSYENKSLSSRTTNHYSLFSCMLRARLRTKIFLWVMFSSNPKGERGSQY